MMGIVRMVMGYRLYAGGFASDLAIAEHFDFAPDLVNVDEFNPRGHQHGMREVAEVLDGDFLLFEDLHRGLARGALDLRELGDEPLVARLRVGRRGRRRP